MHAYFLSDLHLTDDHGDHASQFINWLDAQSAGESSVQVFLMGDIFDLWIAAHPYFVTKFKRVVTAIESARRRGIHFIYFEGNHDLYLKDFWQEQMGIPVYSEAAYFTVDDTYLRVEHGDQIDLEDKGYRFLRWFLRTPPLQYWARRLPEPWVAAIGERASRTSRRYTSQIKTMTAATAIAKIRRHAEIAVCANPRIDIILSGHLHTVDDYTFTVENKTKRSINLGSWLDRPKVLHLKHGQINFIYL